MVPPSAHRVMRAVTPFLVVALTGALLAVIRSLPATDLSAAGLAWIAPVGFATLTVASSLVVLACLVAGLRSGRFAAFTGAGAAASLAGGAIAVLTGAPAMPPALAAAAAFLLITMAADRHGGRAESQRPRLAMAGSILLLAALPVFLAAIPPAAEWLAPLAGGLLVAAGLMGIAAAIVAPGIVAAALGLALGLAATAVLVDRAGGLEVLIGLALLIGVQPVAVALLGRRSLSRLSEETHLPALATHLTDAVLHFDGRLRLREWNPAAESLLGLDAAMIGTRFEDLLGLSVAELPADDADATMSIAVGGLRISVHRSGTGIVAIVHEPGVTAEGERLGRELRGTLEELLHARRTIELQRAELERLTTIDPLTGVASRGAIVDRLRVEIAQARRYQHPVAVVLLDVDDFTELNRRHGLQAGDAALREVSLRMRLRIRESDALGRAGSDGFIAVLPHTDEGGAATFADALRHRLGQRPILVGGELVTLTASAGVAVMRPGEDLDLDGLMARVAEALESARRAGGDRIALDRLHGLARLDEHRPDHGPEKPGTAQDSGR